jgi:hypothetical protein
MKIKTLSLMMFLAFLFISTTQFSKAEARSCAGFSFNIGSFFAPTPRVYESYVVEQYSPYYAEPVYLAPAPEQTVVAAPVQTVVAPTTVYVVPRQRCYRQVIVQRPVPVRAGGFSFGWRSCR